MTLRRLWRASSESSGSPAYANRLGDAELGLPHELLANVLAQALLRVDGEVGCVPVAALFSLPSCARLCFAFMPLLGRLGADFSTRLERSAGMMTQDVVSQ